MSQIIVTKDALLGVRTAIGNFQTEIDGVMTHLQSHAEETLNEARAVIKKQEDLVQSLEQEVERLTGEIERCQEEIIALTHEIECLHSRIATCESETASLNSQIQQLEAQKSRASSSDEDNQNFLRAIQQRIDACGRRHSALQEEIRQNRSRIATLNQTLTQKRTEKRQKEQELAETKKRLNTERNKLERLKNAGAQLESAVHELLSAAKNFKQTSATTTNAGRTGVEKCMAAFDTYLGINLNGTNSGSSGTSAVSRSQVDRGVSHSTQVMSCASGEYHYELGPNNTHHAYGQLRLVPPEARDRRNSAAQSAAGGDRRRNGRFDDGSIDPRGPDEGGHLIGYQFGGEGGRGTANLFPQNRALNRRYSADGPGSGGYANLENEWATLLRDGNQVYVDIYASAANPDAREDAVYGTYTVVRPNGTQYTEAFSFANENTLTQDSWVSDYLPDD